VTGFSLELPGIEGLEILRENSYVPGGLEAAERGSQAFAVRETPSGDGLKVEITLAPESKWGAGFNVKVGGAIKGSSTKKKAIT